MLVCGYLNDTLPNMLPEACVPHIEVPKVTCLYGINWFGLFADNVGAK